MLSSPAKRRKTSSTTSVPVDASGTSQQPLSRDDGPADSQHRFQSPTKASLARSQSGIPRLAHTRSTRSPERHTTRDNEGGETERAQQRTFGLRDRKALRPSLTASWSPTRGPRLSMGPPSPRRPSGIQAFTAPPRRVSTRITPADLIPGASTTLEQRAPSTTSGHQSPSESGGAAREREERRTSESQSSEGDNEEPELPPTPTELGLERAPKRPKGLLSSSPSRLLKKLRKRRISEALGSSPLKKRAIDPSGEERESTGLDLDGHESQGARQRQKEELSARLRQLKEEVEELEKWAKRSEHPDAYLETSNDETRKLISLLTSQISTGASDPTSDSDAPSLSAALFSLLPFSKKKPPKAKQSLKIPTNPFALPELTDPKPYLTVFAPLILTTQSTKISTSVSDALTEIHEITLSAPHPYPQHVYRIPITLRTNPDTQSVTSISVSNKSAQLPSQIHRWIKSRLSNPLTKLDISGLCWGLNRYWEAIICRAQLWASLQKRYPALVGGGISRSSQDGPMGTDPRLLTPHLERTTMLFSSGRPNESRLLISCALTLDEWTSEPQLHPEITLSTRTEKVEHDAKKLFRSLLKGGGTSMKQTEMGTTIHSDSILRAAEGLMSILFPNDIAKSKRSK